nr:hypothetical protein [Pseudomonadota bacterium]
MVGWIFFRKGKKQAERGSEAEVQSGKLYILGESGVLAKPRLATRLSDPHELRPIDQTLQAIAEHNDTVLPSFRVDGQEFIIYAKTGIITAYPFRSRELLNVFWHLQQGIKILHDNGIAHLDIKPANIVLRDNGLPAF